MSLEEQRASDLDLDRLCELLNIGAGHAASALSSLVGRSVRMSIPRLVVPEPNHKARARRGRLPRGWNTGVFFDFEDGMLDGLVGILFRKGMRESLVTTLLGESATPHPRPHVESALREVGNILVSGVASAIADTIGGRILPSVPELAMEGARGRLAELARRRAGDDPIRIEIDLMDESGELGGLLVLVPDAISRSSLP